MDFHAMAQQCAPNVAPQTMAALVTVESSHNPYAIGVVNGALASQPRSLREALASVDELLRQDRNFSMGLAQVNRHNVKRYNTSYEALFDPCTNLRVGAMILEDCYVRALGQRNDPQMALRAAFSCYYSGNFNRGFVPDKPGTPSYVQKVLIAAGRGATPKQVVPAIDTTASPAPQLNWNSSVLMDAPGVAVESGSLSTEHTETRATSAQPTSSATRAPDSAEVF